MKRSMEVRFLRVRFGEANARNLVLMAALSLVLAGGICLDNEEIAVLEPAKRVSVVHDVDVAVAGGGISGVFAAIAAARMGARTVLIERFESLGGVAGPGINPGGGVQMPGRSAWEEFKRGSTPYPYVWIFPEIAGLPREFALKLQDLTGPRWNSLERSNAFSYLCTKMAVDAGVSLLLSTYVCDPILEESTIRGLYVEGKSGRQAVKARVVIDATGEADVARRAKVRFLSPKESYFELDSHAPNGIGIWAYVAGINWEKYESSIQSGHSRLKFRPHQVGDLAQVQISEPESGAALTKIEPGLGGMKVQLVRPHAKVDAGNILHMSQLQAAVRIYIFEAVQEIRRSEPGCENAYLVAIAPYLGIRGGPCIEGEYTLTMDDCLSGRRFDDVIYLYGENRVLQKTCATGSCVWADVPYRVMVPKNLKGLLAVGRSASGIPDTLLRNRTAVQHMGEAAGIAAAMAAKSGTSPGSIDVKGLQRRLLDAGYYLGTDERLRQLGLR